MHQQTVIYLHIIIRHCIITNFLKWKKTSSCQEQDLQKKFLLHSKTRQQFNIKYLSHNTHLYKENCPFPNSIHQKFIKILKVKWLDCNLHLSYAIFIRFVRTNTINFFILDKTSLFHDHEFVNKLSRYNLHKNTTLLGH